MPKKSIKKKKLYKEMCRKQVQHGRGNMPDGTWKPFGNDNSMPRDMKAGYKL